MHLCREVHCCGKYSYIYISHFKLNYSDQTIYSMRESRYKYFTKDYYTIVSCTVMSNGRHWTQHVNKRVQYPRNMNDDKLLNALYSFELIPHNCLSEIQSISQLLLLHFLMMHTRHLRTCIVHTILALLFIEMHSAHFLPFLFFMFPSWYSVNDLGTILHINYQPMQYFCQIPTSPVHIYGTVILQIWSQ